MAIYTDILKELRKDKNLTQGDMAEYFNTKQSMYSMYESRKRTMQIEMLCALADILETSTYYILGRTAKKSRTKKITQKNKTPQIEKIQSAVF